MELRVFDKTVQPLGAIDELASLLWHTKYFDVGTFSLLAPITDNNSRLLVEGNLITKHDGKKEVKTADGGVWRRAAQITYVHITKDENGLEQLEAQGYMLSWWLNKRCIYPQIVATGTNQYLINLMVKNNCGSAAGTKRRFPLFTFLAQETIDGVAVEYANEVYAQLGQEVKQALLNHAKQAGVSIADLNMQLGFLWEELQGYTAVMDALKKAGSVRAASDAVLTGYEKPADQSETVKKKRAEYGEGYYKKYAAGNGTKYYRVRKSWTDAASQLGAFTSLENAKSACKAGYTVYDDNGKAVYTAAGQQTSAGVPFSVQVDILDLNIRTGAGTNYAKTGETTGKGVFTIVEVKAGQGASAGWGRLKSGAGWISLDYATRLA